MNIFKYIIALYIFLALLLVALATAVYLVYAPFAKYAYATALVIHSFYMFYEYKTTLKALSSRGKES